MDEDQALAALAALAQSVRLRAYRALVQAGPDGLPAGELATALQVAPNALSFHLKELTHAGLVRSQRHGRHLIYRATFDTMNALLAYLTENCCQGQACTPLGARRACVA
ncbi:MAG: winged helix-turn-helix domain-containing protein [Tepidimonas sp.]|uniref:ArsR/SmtB family transcription factor n=1 Tax=Tepidimonas sp. TaxID=2002775 RepID=UPI00298EEAAD|nr:winged helix-turn-helix domain-containing protein [Tepidimonas sp.]MDW8337284.1 winged helix-turn-helix domain-containing protein [Tepidimonas sp.]